jgi:hypothetical protein
MAYMAIVEGARGLWWWSLGTNALQDVCSGWCAQKTAYMNNLTSVVNEIAALEPALLSDDAPNVLTGNSNSGAIRTKVKIVANTGYVFAYNYTGSPQSATFTLSTLPSSITVNAEGRTIAPAGAAFTDTFGPYQAHVYVLGNVVGTPLTVSFTAPAANTTVSATVPVTVSARGGSGSGYTYTITADGGTISSGNSSSVLWDTKTVANGSRVLTVTVRDSVGSTASASRSVMVANTPASLSVAYNGKSRDRVGQGNTALAPDGVADGVLTATLSASGGRTVTGLALQSSGPGAWDTDGGTQSWALGVATALDGPLLNNPATAAVSFPIADGGTFVLFASDFGGIEFVPGATLTLTATFSDGTTTSAATTVGVAPPSPLLATTLSLTYNGKSRDRVGQGNTALAPDGAADGVLTATLSASGGRTVTGLALQSSGPGAWDTNGGTQSWALGVATALDGPLLNNPATAAVSFPIADGGTFVLFASDFGGIEFVPGATLTLTATFSDGTTASAATTVGATPPSPLLAATLSLTYNGKSRDRVGQGNTALAPDGVADGVLTATLSASGGRTVTGLALQSSGPGAWDTDGGTQSWALGVATAFDGPLLNNPATAAVSFPIADGGTFVLFASDFGGIEFVPGATLTLTATFSDGTTASAVARVP